MSEFAKRPQRTPNNHLSRPARTNGKNAHSAPVDHRLQAHQQAVSNQAMQRLLQARVMRAKLTINEPGDQYEQEADRVSEQVMRMPGPGVAAEAEVRGRSQAVGVQRKCPKREQELLRKTLVPNIQRMCPECEEGEEHLLAREACGQAPAMTPAIQGQINTLRGGGQPLPQPVRAFFEPRFGYDCGQVRIHTDVPAGESARAVNALAYTVGRDVVFRAGHYAPETLAGSQLLAHELAHVVQQTVLPSSTPSLQRDIVEDEEEGGVLDWVSETGRDLADLVREAGGAVMAEPGRDGPTVPLLQVGSSGPLVRLLQSALNIVGASPLLIVDGLFGSRTQSAVLGFQQANSLAADGLVGPKTRDALEESSGLAFKPKGPAAPLTSGGCPPYSQAERDASRDSGGQFDQPGAVGPTVAQQALMWDFRPGETATLPGHMAGALKMVVDLGLETTAPSATIAILLGHTDCVDNESRNAPLRAGRAHAARELFKEVGAREEFLGPAEPATQGPLPGDERTERARNRSAVILVMPPPKRDGTPPVPPKPAKQQCDANADPGKEWSVEDVANATIAGGLGAGLFTFILKNCESGCEYECVFVGFGGGLGAGVSISLPGAAAFTTPDFFVNPKGFQGEASVFSASAGIGPAGAEHAFISLRAVNTEPDEIDIGGVEGGFGTPISVIGLEGKFFVRTKGLPRAPCP